MDKAERDRRHQANLERINRVRLVAGSGDRAHVDHEGTLFERARMTMEEISAHRATEAGLQAFERLLRLAEQTHLPQAGVVAAFIAAVCHGQPLPLATLRGPDPMIADDMLAVLDAFRHARLGLAEHVEGGPARVCRVLEQWRLARA